MVECPEAFHYQQSGLLHRVHIVSLPIALSQVLYAFCKVRGYKVIVRLLTNEPRYVEPMLSCLRSWTASKADESRSADLWQLEYVMLLWLSHLMLAPFELSTLSTSNVLKPKERLQSFSVDLPPVAQDVLDIGFEHLVSPSKEREAAVILLVRLSLRKDMQSINLATRLVEYSARSLSENGGNGSIYQNLGHLSLLYSIVNLGANSEVAPFVVRMYKVASHLAVSNDQSTFFTRDSAPARKLLIKILRACLVHAISLTQTSQELNGDTVNSMLEDSIQFFLDCLGDKDTPVRMAASKALSMTALKLDASLAAEIGEAVLGSLSEDVLLKDPLTRKLMAKTELPEDQALQYTRNLSAVNPLRWHGLMLTLGHLLFRRSLPSHQLPDVIESLLLGLEFEQRSNVGTSLGVGVRDAACFGIWALARKYTTAELAAISSRDIAGLSTHTDQAATSILQILATGLVISACLDPSGNIRRGSSAALQELIGRHPDTIMLGIAVVQTVDYTAVARRSRAIMEVAVQAASLEPEYHSALLQKLCGWRGATAADSESRRWAAAAMRMLLVNTQWPSKLSLLRSLAEEVYRLGMRNLGSAASGRHGLLLCVAAVGDSLISSSSLHSSQGLLTFDSFDITKMTGDLKGRPTADLEVVIEGVCTFIDAFAQLRAIVGSEFEFEALNFTAQILPVLERCITASERQLTIDASSRAITAVFGLMSQADQDALLKGWLDAKGQKHTDLMCSGRLSALAALYAICPTAELQHSILNFLTQIVNGNTAIEVKTSAMKSICILLQSAQELREDAELTVTNTMIKGLTDYTNDQRGDIGSLLRLQSLEAVDILYAVRHTPASSSSPLLPHVTRLSVEKLNKVRHRAWLCLKMVWSSTLRSEGLRVNFQHPEDVCTEKYYDNMLHLLLVAELQQPLLIGIASSISGTEDVSRAACCALTTAFLVRDQHNVAGLVVTTAVNYLNEIAPGEDHAVLPVLELLTFSLGQVHESHATSSLFAEETWGLAQKLQPSASSIDRVDAMIRSCDALAMFPSVQKQALDKLTRQLLHRYPKIRNAAADVTFAAVAQDDMLLADWNMSAMSNKSLVLSLRKDLGIAKAAAS